MESRNEEAEEGKRVREIKLQIKALEIQLHEQVQVRKSLEEKAKRVLNKLVAKQAEITKASQQLEAAELKSRALQGEDIRFREKIGMDQTLQQLVDQIPLQDAIQLTQAKLEQVNRLITSSTAINAAATMNKPEEISHISIVFNADETEFGVTRETTFDMLSNECARRWRLSAKSECELKRLENNESFSPLAVVCDTLPTGSTIRFHVAIRSISDAPVNNNPRVTFTPANNNTQATAPTSNEALVESPSPAVPPPPLPPRIVLIRKLQKLAWEDQAREESVFYDSNSVNWLWLLVWALVLALYIASMVYRFNTAAAFTLAQHTQKVLANTPFNLTNNNDAATFAHGMTQSADVEAWLDSVALPWYSTTATGLGARTLFNQGTVCNTAIEPATCPAGSNPMQIVDFSLMFAKNSGFLVCESTFDLHAAFATGRGFGDLLVFQFNTLNSDTGSVLQVNCLAQVGLDVLTQIQVQVLPLSVFASHYQTSMQPLIIISDVLLTLFACALLYNAMQSSRLWTVVALALWICAMVQLCLAINFEVAVAPSVTLVSQDYQDLSYQLDAFHAYLSMSCATLFLLIVLGVKLMQWSQSRSVNLMFRALNRALARNFISILFLTIWALAAMSIWANLAFGPYLPQWTSIQDCVSQLAGVLFGATVDFAALRSSQYTVLWITIFFLCWFGFIVLVVGQLFAVCVLDAYLEVYAVSNDREKEESRDYSWHALLHRAWRTVVRESKRE